MRKIAAMALIGSMCVSPFVYANESPDALVLHVLNRVAFGPSATDLEHVRTVGVDRYIDEQLHPERIALPASLQSRIAQDPVVGKSQRELVDQFRDDAKAIKAGGETAKQQRRADYRRMAIEAGDARLVQAIDSPRQLQEVMVDFWYNHFNVFAGKGLDRVLVANYEREAIRPYVLGRFRDLLGATAHHPAMLFYLDNYLSTSATFKPRRPNANQQASGLNENYARELMELHTLGVDGGYTQHDVTELARMFTGWTIDRRGQSDSMFQFDSDRHDFGGKEWLNRHVSGRGEPEADWALDVLASSPQTAHHISYQLAQYFVSDTPPDSLVAKLTATYSHSDGDIRSVLATLFSSAEFRDPANFGAKFKTPYQFVVSSVRAAALPTDNVVPLLGELNQLGMPLYGCQTPDGYKNTADAWINSDAITRRIGFATALASGRVALNRRGDPLPDAGASSVFNDAQHATPVDANPLAALLGPTLGTKTRDALTASPPQMRAALILGSPDFMRH